MSIDNHFRQDFRKFKKTFLDVPYHIFKMDPNRIQICEPTHKVGWSKKTNKSWVGNFGMRMVAYEN